MCSSSFYHSASVKPENYEAAKEGERALLPCDKLEIFSDDTVSWKKNGKNVIEKQVTTRASILKNGTLVLNPVDRKDWGLYVCSVTTKRFGDEVTMAKTMFLNVQCKIPFNFFFIFLF